MPAITGPITTVNPSNTYSTHYAEQGQGGYRTVADAAARDAITVPRRREGMLVKTLDDGKHWELSSDLTTWSFMQLSSSFYVVMNLAGLVATPSPAILAAGVVLFDTAFDGASGDWYFDPYSLAAASPVINIPNDRDSVTAGRWFKR